MNLVDRVLPRVPIRQWVLSVPFELRLALAKDTALLSAVVRIQAAEISRLMRRLGEERGVRQGATGMVAAIQLFGGSINLNPHNHLLSLDGVYHNDGERAVFTEVRAPSDAEVAEVVLRIQKRVMRTLERRGLLRDPLDARDPGQEDPITSCGQLSLRVGKLGRVDEHGNVLPDDDDARFGKRGKRLCADIDGWNLHAAVTVRADDDVGRESLCRYIVRHPISLQRLSLTRDGRVAYAIKYPRGNKTHLLMQPVQFLARLASLIPPPRHPLVRYFGVLSSASKWRQHVVPMPKAESKRDKPLSSEPRTDNKIDVAVTLAAVAANDAKQPGGEPGQRSEPTHRGAIQAASNYVDWATLLRRVFDVDSLACARCGGRLRIIATITEQPAICAILDSLGITSTPPLPHARAPDPQLDLGPVVGSRCAC